MEIVIVKLLGEERLGHVEQPAKRSIDVFRGVIQTGRPGGDTVRSMSTRKLIVRGEAFVIGIGVGLPTFPILKLTKRILNVIQPAVVKKTNDRIEIERPFPLRLLRSLLRFAFLLGFLRSA